MGVTHGTIASFCEILEASPQESPSRDRAQASRDVPLTTNDFREYKTLELLRAADVLTRGHLQVTSLEDLQTIDGIGPRRAEEARQLLLGLGLQCRDESDPLGHRIGEIYGSVDDAPIQLLKMLMRRTGLAFLSATLISWLEEESYATLGGLSKIPEDELRSLAKSDENYYRLCDFLRQLGINPAA